ncbi:hypothetical protein BDP67DRAFT_567310 [Colletotrichum lupini]|nr:hypothetical protein BDP67DRAFT_567310 [Colletotrichum lupini]
MAFPLFGCLCGLCLWFRLGKEEERNILCGTYSVVRTPKTQAEFAGAYQYLIPWCSPDEKDVEDEKDERLGWHGGCQARCLWWVGDAGLGRSSERLFPCPSTLAGFPLYENGRIITSFGTLFSHGNLGYTRQITSTTPLADQHQERPFTEGNNVGNYKAGRTIANNAKRI